jgi:hypothetical protein
LRRYELHWQITYERGALDRVGACGALARLAGLTYAKEGEA